MVELTLEQAIAKVMALADATEADLDFITDLLQASAGIGPAGEIVYRHWYTTARKLQVDLDKQALTAADGASFTNYTTPIRTYLDLQLGIDLSTPLIVPPGFTAIEALNQLCGCSDGKAWIMSAFTV